MSVTLEELKDHLRIIGNNEDSTLTIILNGSIDLIENLTGHALKRSAKTSYFDRFSSNMELNGHNPESIVINYIDTDGNEQVLDSSVYSLKTHKAKPYITLGYNQSWPNLQSVDAPVWIEYTSGFNENTIPDALKSAVLIEAATHYEYREDETMAKTHARNAVKRLISPLILYKT